MILLEKLKRLVYQSDMFCSSEMLRYNSETQYKTLTGGFFSISIFIFIITGFASMISDTLNRITISSSLQTIKQSDPPLSILRTDKEHMFMFGVSILTTDLSLNIDLGADKRYFDVMIVVGQTQNGVITKMDLVPMEKCTIDHWKMLSIVGERFNVLAASTWLCPPLNFDFSLQGSYSSPLNSLIELQVGPCKNSSMFDKHCAPQNEIDELMLNYQNLYLTVNYINPVISPSQPSHISYYLETSDYVIFSNTVGSEAWIYFSDYTINTDNSIWPLEDSIVETGCIVEQKAINHPFSVSLGTPYAAIYLAKSINSLIYTRSVQKVSAVLSYIGGLVGAITAVMFLIKSYTDSSLEITIGINLFNDHEQEQAQREEKGGLKQPKPAEKPTFNFFKFVALSCHQVLKFFGVSLKWPETSKLEMFQEQILHQLDIKTLLKRINFLQLWMTYLFDEHQLQGMKYQKPISCEMARRMRRLVVEEGEEEQKTKMIKKKTEKEQNVCVSENISEAIIHKRYELTAYSHSHAKVKQSQGQNVQQNNIVYNNKFINEQSGKISESLNNPLEQIPVLFMDNIQELSEEKVYSEKKDVIQDKSLILLKKLYRGSRQDEINHKIWSNMREAIKEKIKTQIGNPILQIYS